MSPPKPLVVQVYRHYFGHFASQQITYNQASMVSKIIDHWWRSLCIKPRQSPKTTNRRSKKNSLFLLGVQEQENIMKTKLRELLNTRSVENDAYAIYLLNIGFNNSAPYNRLCYDTTTKKLSCMNQRVVNYLYNWQRYSISLSVGFFVLDTKPMKVLLDSAFEQKPKVEFHSACLRELYKKTFCYGGQCVKPNAESFTTASGDNSCYLEGNDSDSCEEGGGYDDYYDSDSDCGC